MSQEEFPRTWNRVQVAVGRLEIGACGLPGSSVPPGTACTPSLALGYWLGPPSRRRWGALAFGQTRTVPDSGRPVDHNTSYDWASLTKLVSATLFATFVDRGWVDWETPLAAVLPEFPKSIRFSHLLSHSAGYPAWSPLWRYFLESVYPRPIWQVSEEEAKTWLRQRLAATPQEYAVGERVLYSDFSFLILGLAIEQLLGGGPGAILRAAMRRLVLDPLGCGAVEFPGRSAFKVAKADLNVAATEVCHFRGGLIQGEVHDENAWTFGSVAAHAGAFGTLSGLLKFGMGVADGVVLSPGILHRMWAPVEAGGIRQTRTLGWDMPSGANSAAGRYFSKASVGHLGFTGTSLWIDPKRDLGIALLTHRVHPTRNREGVREMRIQLHEALCEDLGF